VPTQKFLLAHAKNQAGAWIKKSSRIQDRKETDYQSEIQSGKTKFIFPDFFILKVCILTKKTVILHPI